MNGRCHSISGVISGATTAAVVACSQSIPVIGACTFIGAVSGLVGGLFPDIDKQGTTISKKARVTSFVASKVTGHRGVLHTPAVAFLFGFGLLYLISYFKVQNIFFQSAIYAFVFAFLSHLILDLLTPRGIMLLYPISTKRIHIIGFKTKAKEFIGVLIISSICFFVILNYFLNINIIQILISDIQY